MNRRYILFSFCLFFCLQILRAQVIIGPLEANPELWYSRPTGVRWEQGPSAFMFPSGSKNFYQLDTLTLPVVDDFSKDRRMRFESWIYPQQTDSQRIKYRILPEPEWPFVYSVDTAFIYSVNAGSVDSVESPKYQIIWFNHPDNPFVPNDTQTVWKFQPIRIFHNSLTSTIDTVSLLPSGTLSDDTVETFRVFFPNGDGSIWTDRQVYINRTMALAPPTTGVATFDGTDAYGRPYSNVIGANGWADRLTSKPIDLNYPASDSIYLSFWYQPEGLGYAPEGQDSLRVEFFDPDTQIWRSVWSVKGESLHRFKPVCIPITNPVYLKKGFRFRFSNYANLNGNVDHWNIDYVKLDRFRHQNDTIVEDVGLVYVRPTILRRYQRVPYNQFRQSMVENKWECLISNRDTVSKRVAYRFLVYDNDNQLINSYPQDYTPLPSDTSDVLPFYTDGYADYSRFRFPDFNYNFETAGLLPFADSTRLRISHIIENFDTDVCADNDTVHIYQEFYNYWAYDDGTAERAVWLGMPGRFVMKFTNEVPDTLYGISIYFSPVRENNETRNIYLQVYQSIQSSENLLYEEQVRIGPVDGDTSAFRVLENNGFTTYILKEPVFLPAGDFYVGWRQTQTFKANVGFDLNSDASEYTWFKTGPNWIQMEEYGAAMIRPMVANPFKIQDLSVQPEPDEATFLIYPNPAHTQVHIQTSLPAESIEIIDLSGRTIRRFEPTETISVQDLENGLYIVKLIPEGGVRPLFQKLLIRN